jgi:hypothetical protein
MPCRYEVIYGLGGTALRPCTWLSDRWRNNRPAGPITHGRQRSPTSDAS